MPGRADRDFYVFSIISFYPIVFFSLLGQYDPSLTFIRWSELSFFHFHFGPTGDINSVHHQLSSVTSSYQRFTPNNGCSECHIMGTAILAGLIWHLSPPIAVPLPASSWPFEFPLKHNYTETKGFSVPMLFQDKNDQRSADSVLCLLRWPLNYT